MVSHLLHEAAQEVVFHISAYVECTNHKWVQNIAICIATYTYVS